MLLACKPQWNRHAFCGIVSASRAKTVSNISSGSIWSPENALLNLEEAAEMAGSVHVRILTSEINNRLRGKGLSTSDGNKVRTRT